MRTTLTRALVTAAAILALAASPALARPGGPASASAAAAQQRQQDLRHLEAGNSVSHSPDLGPVYVAPAPAPGNSVVRHSPDLGPVYVAPAPAPVSHPATHASGSSDNSDPWLVIALGVAGFCVLAAGAIVVTNGMRANPRTT
jgi:hypothetical protein